MITRQTVSPEAKTESVDDSSINVPSNLPGATSLKPALDTGHPLLDDEHRFLEGAMANLHRICVDRTGKPDCNTCGAELQADCERQLISVLGDVFAFILEHFRTEESIMRDSLMLMVDRDVCHAHIEDHAEISAKVQQIVMALDPAQVARHISDLDALFRRWIEHHMALHDQVLTRWLGREDSLLSSR